jgi:hypothetical protein
MPINDVADRTFRDAFAAPRERTPNLALSLINASLHAPDTGP